MVNDVNGVRWWMGQDCMWSNDGRRHGHDMVQYRSWKWSNIGHANGQTPRSAAQHGQDANFVFAGLLIFIKLSAKYLLIFYFFAGLLICYAGIVLPMHHAEKHYAPHSAPCFKVLCRRCAARFAGASPAASCVAFGSPGCAGGARCGAALRFTAAAAAAAAAAGGGGGGDDIYTTTTTTTTTTSSPSPPPPLPPSSLL